MPGLLPTEGAFLRCRKEKEERGEKKSVIEIAFPAWFCGGQCTLISGNVRIESKQTGSGGTGACKGGRVI